MSKGNIIFLILLGLALCFCVVMLIQSFSYPQSTLQEMRPMAMGKFIVYRDCYNSPQYYLDANPIPSAMAMRMDNRSEYILLTDLKENSEYRLYGRQGILKMFYFVECVGGQ
jgi:hypothetical protein